MINRHAEIYRLLKKTTAISYRRIDRYRALVSLVVRNYSKF